MEQSRRIIITGKSKRNVFDSPNMYIDDLKNVVIDITNSISQLKENLLENIIEFQTEHMIERLADKLQDSLVDINLQSFITSQIKNDLANLITKFYRPITYKSENVDIRFDTTVHISDSFADDTLHDRKEQDKIIDMNFNIDRTGNILSRIPNIIFRFYRHLTDRTNELLHACMTCIRCNRLMYYPAPPGSDPTKQYYYKKKIEGFSMLT